QIGNIMWTHLGNPLTYRIIDSKIYPVFKAFEQLITDLQVTQYPICFGKIVINVQQHQWVVPIGEIEKGTIRIMGWKRWVGIQGVGKHIARRISTITYGGSIGSCKACGQVEFYLQLIVQKVLIRIDSCGIPLHIAVLVDPFLVHIVQGGKIVVVLGAATERYVVVLGKGGTEYLVLPISICIYDIGWISLCVCDIGEFLGTQQSD